MAERADKIDITVSEFYTENVKMNIRVERQLYSAESEFQRIDVFESQEFGRFLTLEIGRAHV